MKPLILTAVTLTIAAIFMMSRLWQPVELGPDLANPKAFFGCYGLQASKAIISSTDVAVPSQGRHTKVNTFLVLKRDVVVNTVNDLQLDDNGKNLSVGNADTGFIYKFDSDTNPMAIVIPDVNGVERVLPRVRC